MVKSKGLSFSLVLAAMAGICSVAIAAQNIWIQSDWSQGQGASTTDQYSQATDIDASTPEHLTLSEAADWDFAGWSHRQEIAIANAGAVQTDYQVRLIVAYAAEMQADFDDLRFANANGTELDHWLRTKTDSVEAEVWVEVDDLAAAGDTIVHMYYGNDSAASASDGEATFPFFDGFDGPDIDFTKWTEIDIPADELRVENGWLVFERFSNGSWNKALIANATFARGDLSFESDYVWVLNNVAYDAIMYGWHDSGFGTSYADLVYAYYNPGSGGAPSVGVHVYEDGNSRAGEIGVWTVGTDYDIRVRMRESGGAYYEQSEDGGDTWLVSYTSAYSTEADLRPAWSFHSGTHRYDNARVRKWMDAEPVATFGAIEVRYALSGSLTSNILDTDAIGSHWGLASYETAGSGVVVVKVRTSHDESMTGAPDFSTCGAVTDGEDLTDNGCVEDGHRYVQYHVSLEGDGVDTPIFEEISIGFTPADVIANAGEDRTIAAGRSFMLDGSFSAGEGLSYNWALVSGDGQLASVQSMTPVYTSDRDVPNQDVLIYLTVRNAMGRVDTDEVTLHVIALRDYEIDDKSLVGEVGGMPVYERLDALTGRLKLVVGEDEVSLPVDSGGYTFASTSDNRLLVGLPEMDDESGRAFLLTQPAGSMGLVDLTDDSGAFSSVDGNQVGDRLGAFIAISDLDGDGSDDILIGSPDAASYGTATIYDSDLNAGAVLVGTEGHPVNSLLVGNNMALGHRFVAFGPGNPAFNANLSFDADVSASRTPFAFLTAEAQYLSGVVVLDDDVLQSPADPSMSAELISLGDLNGDGDSDILLSSDGDASYLYFSAKATSDNSSEIDPSVSFAGISGANLLGHRAVVGDVSGDGLADIVIGIPEYDSSGRGAVFVVFGAPVWSGTADLMSSANVLLLLGTEPGDRIGSDIVLVDTNGDGVEEIFSVAGDARIVKFDLTTSGAAGGSSGCTLIASTEPEAGNIAGLTLLAFLALLAPLAGARRYV